MKIIGHGGHALSVSDALGDNHHRAGTIVAIGHHEVRKALGENEPLTTVVHPTAYVSKSATIGDGSFIGAFAYVGPEVVIGEGCIVNTGAIVEHECQLGEYVHVAVGATLCGGVRVGDASWIGAGATVREFVSIGDHATVAMGAVVVKNVLPDTTVKGVPAK